MTRWFVVLLFLLASLPAQAASEQIYCAQVSEAKLSPGSGYAPGTYANLPLVPWGTTSGADDTITVTVGAGGSVADVQPIFNGHDYTLGDVLTAAVPGGGSGFMLIVKGIRDMPYGTTGEQDYDRFAPAHLPADHFERSRVVMHAHDQMSTLITQTCTYADPPRGPPAVPNP